MFTRQRLSGPVWLLILLVCSATVARGQAPFAQGVGIGPAGYVFRVADLDGDGDLDIAAIRTFNMYAARRGAVWLENKGPYDFAEHPVDDFADTIEIADMNSDHRPDLLITNWEGIKILQNDSTPTQHFTPTLIPGGTANLVQAADLDGDGRMDLLAGYPAKLVFLKRLPGPDYAFTPYALSSFATTDNRLSFATADLNHDGHVDIIYSFRVRAPEDGTYVLTNPGNPVDYTYRKLTDLAGPVSCKDMNKDGRPDILVGDQLFLGQDADGVSFSTMAIPSETGQYVNFGLVVADVNQDGYPDVIRRNGDVVLYNDAATTPTFNNLQSSQPVFTADYLQYHETDVATGDMDGDGDTDIISGSVEHAGPYTFPSSVVLTENFTVGAFDVKVLSPQGGEGFVGGDPVAVRWRSRVETAGTAVGLELWQGETRELAHLTDTWNENGLGTTTVTLPLLIGGHDLRIRAVSLWDAQYHAFNPAAFAVQGKTGIDPALFDRYR